MKKTIYSLLLACICCLTACEDFTEIQPKGKNLLSTATDLDMLLNFDYNSYVHFGFYANNMAQLTNDIYPGMDNIANLISDPHESMSKALGLWDESIDRAGLAISDDTYSNLYELIGTVCNPILQMADEATGDRSEIQQYKAEAYLLRAYVHYLLVNIYAKGYQPETAASDPGICLLLETQDLQADVEKNTVQEVYDQIVSDIEAAISSGALPVKASNKMRCDLPFAYAVKAKVMMSIRNYGEAEEAARQSLALNSYVEDYNPYDGAEWTHPQAGNEQDLFMIPASPMMQTFTDEMAVCFEEGDIMSTNYASDLDIYGISFGMLYLGIPTLPMFFSSNCYINGLGLTTSDMLLTVAECALRRGDVGTALEEMDAIRVCRISSNVYQPLAGTVDDASEAWQRMEQLSRTENWYTIRTFINLKRWNTEAEHSRTLTKTLLDNTYTLSPTSPLWIFPFPQNAVGMNPNLTQNY